MWLFTPIGFFSIVQKTKTKHLTVRARVKGDLLALRGRYLPELSEVLTTPGNDYPFRGTVSHEALARAVGKMVLDVDYSNFKSEVAKKLGKAREEHYHQVWAALLPLQLENVAPVYSENVAPIRSPKPPWPTTVKAGYKLAYGGVVFDEQGNILIREPRNHYDGYVWTFPKGRPDPDETPEQTALRETLEETGAAAQILAPIPGEYAGGTSINRYFLMLAPIGSGGLPEDDLETVSVRWVTPAEAKTLIDQTTNSTGHRRDTAVLAAALAAWAAWQQR